MLSIPARLHFPASVEVVSFPISRDSEKNLPTSHCLVTLAEYIGSIGKAKGLAGGKSNVNRFVQGLRKYHVLLLGPLP